MKICTSCGIRSKNKDWAGEDNPYNAEHCYPCASIHLQVDLFAKVLSQPNILGQSRTVVLVPTIYKRTVK